VKVERWRATINVVTPRLMNHLHDCGVECAPRCPATSNVQFRQVVHDIDTDSAKQAGVIARRICRRMFGRDCRYRVVGTSRDRKAERRIEHWGC